MKVKATYRDLKDEGKADFMARIMEWDVPDNDTVEEVEDKVKMAAPPGFKLESFELE
jgi:hypothetical protein